MTTTICCLFGLSLAVAALNAQAPDKKHSVSMDVRTVGSGGVTRTKKDAKVDQGVAVPGFKQIKDENFSTVRKKSSGVTLEVTVRNFRQVPADVTLEWFFLAKPVEREQKFIFDTGTQILSLTGSGTEQIEVDSAEISSSVERKLRTRTGFNDPINNAPTGSEEKKGSKFAGWILRLSAGDELLQVRTSTPALETLARDPGQLAALPRKLIPKK